MIPNLSISQSFIKKATDLTTDVLVILGPHVERHQAPATLWTLHTVRSVTEGIL